MKDRRRWLRLANNWGTRRVVAGPWAGNNFAIDKSTYSAAVRSDAGTNGLIDQASHSAAVRSDAATDGLLDKVSHGASVVST